MEKHSVYHKIREVLQNARDCPLCKLEEEVLYIGLQFHSDTPFRFRKGDGGLG